MRFRRYLEENGFNMSGVGRESGAEQVKNTTFKLDK